MKTILASLLCLACAATWADERVIEVTYMDQEPNQGGYVTRYLVSDSFLRMDFGQDSDDYVLYDRRTRRVFNVNHERHEAMVIDYEPVDYPKPERWSVDEYTRQNSDGKRRFEISVNGTTCSRMVAMEKLAPEAAAGMAEFTEALAATQAATYRATPPDQRQPCDLARYVLEPRRWYQYGVPVDEVHFSGLSRRLLNFSASVKARPTLFAVPARYRQINLKQIQGGAP
jgi:hypothetical protein